LNVTGTASGAGLINLLYPVGSIYINATNSANPSTYFGVGTWVAFGAGRVPVGFNASDPLFDTAEETGGSKDAIVVAHTHTGTTGGQSAGHTHTFSGTTGGQSQSHNHAISISDPGHSHSGLWNSGNATTGSLNGNAAWFNAGGSGFESDVNPNTTGITATAGNASQDHTHAYSGTTSAVSGDHTHNFTTASAGSSGTNANLQPYITVFMWKRTA
jgi:hypothetical protein